MTTTVRSVYGVNVSTNFPFANDLPPSRAPLDLEFTYTRERPATSSIFANVKPDIELGRLDDGQAFVSVYSDPRGCDLIRYTEVADFHVESERITCHVLVPDALFAVEIYFLGFVMSYWLERFRGFPALHAAAVVLEDRAVAFLSANKGGKTSLAGTLMQAGFPLLTDDVLTIQLHEGVFVGHPGYPQMRMWPDQAEHFMGSHEDLELVHPSLSKRRIPVGHGGLGTFSGTARALGRMYVPERRDRVEGTNIEITPLSSRQAVLTLIRNSFLANVLGAIGLEATRLEFFARLVQRVPIRKLAYPNGIEYLPAVRDAILADVAS